MRDGSHQLNHRHRSSAMSRVEPNGRRNANQRKSARVPGGFPACPGCGILSTMKLSIWLWRLLPILAIVGLVAGPLTTPVSAAAMAAVSDMPTAAMPDDMPCCPDKPAVPDCQKICPLMATCMAKCFSVGPTFSSVAFVLRAEGDAIRPGSDAMGNARSIEPPARPPRT